MRQFLGLFVQVGGLTLCLLLPMWFNPFTATPFEPAKVLFFQIITGSMMLAAVTSCVIDFKNETRSTRVRHWIGALGPLTLPIAGFGVAYLLATVWSIDWRLSLWGPDDNPHGLVTIVCGIVFFLMMTPVLRTKEQINRFVNVLLLGSVPVALYGIVQYLGLDPLDWIANPISPSFSTMGNANFLGAYLAMLVPFTLRQIILAERRERQLRFVVILILQVACLWLTLARGAWLGMMGGSLAFLAVLAWHWQSRILLIASLLASLFAVAMFINMNTIVLRPLSINSTSSSEQVDLPPAKIETASVQTRMVIWRDTVRLLADRWWLGYGPGTFVQVFATRYPSALAETEGPDVWVSDPHNLLLLQLMDSGLIGLGTFLWILIAFCKLVLAVLARGADRATEATLMAISGSAVAFLIQAQFNPVVIVLSVLFWLDMALGAGVYYSTRPVS